MRVVHPVTIAVWVRIAWALELAQTVERPVAGEAIGRLYGVRH
jgi:hypothetical protein